MDGTTIVIGCDHAGYALKEALKQNLEKEGISVMDVGTGSAESVDYPIYIKRVAQAVQRGECTRGIGICGTGIGASIVANRFRGVYAALCCSTEMAVLSRKHNNSNVLILGARTTPVETARQILLTWLATPFENGRHAARIKMIDTIMDP